jgi:hypothetical protein
MQTKKKVITPHQWIPSNKKYHCTYLIKWQHLKAKYKLIAAKKELSFIGSS